MSIKVNTALLTDIKKYGAFDISACFNCGNCTAVCPLTEEESNFPRRLIRYGQLGAKEDILSSRDVWMCYYCGECSETCPREAEPGEYMATLRRYAIANYEPTGLAKLLYKNSWFSLLFTLILAVVLGLFLLTIKPDNELSRWIFQLLPFEVIHDMGIIIGIITALTAAVGVGKMVMSLRRKGHFNQTPDSTDSNSSSENQPANSLMTRIVNAMNKVNMELVTMKRYYTCDEEEEMPFYRKSGFIHWSIMWGFIGLATATALDFLFKDPETDIWLPTRILGTIAGLFLMYGTSYAIVRRLRKQKKNVSHNRLPDWLFLWFLFLAGLTGFWLEVAVFIGKEQMLHHIVFLIHTVIAMELLLLFAYSKFAHVAYRPVALFFHYFHHDK